MKTVSVSMIKRKMLVDKRIMKNSDTVILGITPAMIGMKRGIDVMHLQKILVHLSDDTLKPVTLYSLFTVKSS